MWSNYGPTKWLQSQIESLPSLYTYGKVPYVYINKQNDWQVWHCLSILRMTLFITSSQLWAENGDPSLMACSTALERHHAKGQVCLKFALQCISGDDLDFLSLVPLKVQRETASFQPSPSSNYVSLPVNIWHRVTLLRLPIFPADTSPFLVSTLDSPSVCVLAAELFLS